MRLIDEWRTVLRKAWSVRLILLAGLLEALGSLMPYLGVVLPIPESVFNVLSALTLGGELLLASSFRRKSQMASRIRNALVGVTALGVVAVGYVGGKEGLRLVTYPDIIGVWTGCYGETKGMKFTKGQCDSMLVDSLVVHETRSEEVPEKPGCHPRQVVSRLSLRNLQYRSRGVLPV
ncbi:DUF7940 domain-containing protein [Phyllobacterium sp. P5_D12]